MSQIPLQSISLFSSLDTLQLSEVSQSMRLKVLKDGDILFREGDVGKSFFIVTGGQLEIVQAMGTQEERVLKIVEQGEFLGEMCLLVPDSLRSAAARSVGQTFLLELQRHRFEDMLREQPDFAYQMIQELSDRLRYTNEITINELREKNTELAQAYNDLKAAQAELLVKERMETELKMARTIQMNILPKEVRVPEGVEIGAKMVPARAVGGDFFDILPLSEHKVGVAIGDVSDKGVPAALFMAQFCTLLRADARRNLPPAEVLMNVNNLLQETNEAGMFVTAIYGIYDLKTRQFEYARAGHEVPVIFDAQGKGQELPHGPGSALCLFPDSPLDVQSVHLPPGSTLLMYTDGGTDAMNTEQEFFGLECLTETITRLLDAPVQELCDQVIAELLSFQPEAQFDDATLVAIRSL
jgi:serine phosphatase RsbU (regulator of sigma subunit)